MPTQDPRPSAAAAPSALGAATTPAAPPPGGHHQPDDTSNRAGDAATQALQQEQDALQQMGAKAQLEINEGGRTNDSHEQHNPDGAVHGLPKPALKGTWR